MDRIAEILPAKRADRERFVGLPFRLARDFPSWQPGVRMLVRDLIDPGKNPYWNGRKASFFVAIRDGQVVGRMAVLAPGEIPQRPEAATLLFPDFIDDIAIVRLLLEHASREAEAYGARELIGPMNPNIHSDLGIRISGFERPNAILMNYQPAYYSRHLEATGFVPLREVQAWGLFRDTFQRNGPMRGLSERVMRAPGLRIRAGDLARFDEELKILHHLYSAAFADHWGFVPPTMEEFHFLANDLRLLLRSNMTLIAEWNGEPVGFVLSVPDFYSILPKHSSGRLTPGFLLHVLRRWRRVDVVRVMIAGVLPDHRSRGIHLPLFHRIACEIFDLGYSGGEISWVMRENSAMGRALELLGAAPTTTYRLYSKPLSD